MTATSTHAMATYKSVEVSSRSPLELVAMLYEGATTALVQTREAMQRRDLVTKRHAMSKALAIVNHLQNTLDLEAGGDIAAELDRLYTYVTDRIVEANLSGDARRVDEALRVLDALKDAWAQVAANTPVAA